MLFNQIEVDESFSTCKDTQSVVVDDERRFLLPDKSEDNGIPMNDSQFIISTHSPMLMAFPDAELYQIKGNEIVSTPFKETDHYRITVRFLQNPEEAANEILGRDDP